MTTSQIVPVVPGVIGNINCLTIDGRTLHSTLKVKRVFSSWITGRISKYGFIQGQDFEVFTQSGENSEGGRPSQEYTLTTDMGKELCMVENNEAGRVVRRYFIECERALREGAHGQPVSVPVLTPSTPADRIPLRSLVHAWSQVCGQPHQALWPQVKAHFQLSRIDDLPVEWIPDALAFVQSKIDGLPKALPKSTPERFALDASEPDLDDLLYRFSVQSGDFLKSVSEIIRTARPGASRRYMEDFTTPKGNTIMAAFYGLEHQYGALDENLTAMIGSLRVLRHAMRI